MKLAVASFTLIAVVALMACGSHHNTVTVTTPTNHRETLPTTTCTPQVPDGSCTSSLPGTASCATDSDCTAGLDGVCKQVSGICGCVYDQCLIDSDCGARTACSCDANRGGAGNSGSPTACVPANCRIDADCGPGGFCSPSIPGGCQFGASGYYCHTPDDECGNAIDCGSLATNCTYSVEVQHWVCSTATSCGG